MKWEELLDKPLHEMSEEEIEELTKKLSLEQLRMMERKIKKKLRSRPVRTKKKKEREDEFNKALLGVANDS